MDVRNLIHPMTAGDLVQSACVLAIRERGDGNEIRMLECVGLEEVEDWHVLPGAHRLPNARATVTFRDRHSGEQHTLELKASTPLLFTRISV